EAQESKRQYEDLRTTTDQLSKKASAGAVVKGRGFNLVATQRDLQIFLSERRHLFPEPDFCPCPYLQLQGFQP
ncbi:MAG: hypothetical protein II547_04585, partial [Treponema sp.]|nr:hypothetical protein [Treponema sp.]